MRLTDIVSAMGLAAYPEVGLVIFVGVFVAVALRVYGRRRPEELSRCAAMALEDEAGATE